MEWIGKLDEAFFMKNKNLWAELLHPEDVILLSTKVGLIDVSL